MTMTTEPTTLDDALRRAKLAILDAVEYGRILPAYVDALELYGVPAAECCDVAAMRLARELSAGALAVARDIEQYLVGSGERIEQALAAMDGAS